ncbi:MULTISPECIES: type I glutamate--ammonia ligase [Pseudoxanthomonas]|jgi:glutamine synthetase|uniref:Glutamine synthetase n=1 Tax=Pseudoxanthomonas winnipegensis TaxID=2480810 RepID=A0A4Q8L5U8_9GAMM|nr:MULTISPECIES: type I glutamate--ammonia ligase [Pseudoxanthomonas]PZP60144.1 MAG: type I glutamate--ammonia ligase [Pseudoxanthomonas spadix]TAA21373.1 type I glutamate--ammonia ligase [Pseudoxanthomonas winnipegensis]TMN17376.1 type I glutamate--ammonia ligase [Pseudoxanthomonas sp. X-1]UAY74434.1 type I glutamate--ammonia ligase [Pseudoxanthomonas sp. X-1]
MSVDKVEKLIKDSKAEFVDLRFVDLRGVQQHVTFPASIVEPSLFEEGKMFDGSSIAGWKGINESDMVLMPDADTAYLDPFYADPTINLTCDVLDPATMTSYARCPRGVAKRAEAYLQSSGIADLAFFGPEPEFFIFDSVRFANEMGNTFFKIDSEEAAWNSAAKYEGGNSGYRPGVKGGYFPVPPTDSLHDIRAEMVKTLEQVGIETEVHHHEVATAGQCEIGTKFNTLVKKADELLMLKYIVKNVAFRNGKTATFMPKPIVGDNGSGMHVHQSLAKGGTNLFAGDGYGGLSQLALWYIGGIFKHAKAINAFSNSGTNSYKRLVPGFEAPVMLAYSARNRSASCRIPWVNSPKARRIEMRFPDPLQSGYLTFTALMMAGLDGIKNQIDPGAASDKDLYDLPPEEEKLIPQVCSSLDQALAALDADREFLKAGDVFSDDLIDGYIDLKMQEVTKFRAATHPLEYQLYYAN